MIPSNDFAGHTLDSLKQRSIKILRDVFGHNEFRHDQSKVIQHVLNGNDCLVIMPTGGGKSVCYQIPALMLDGLTIVVSPLIALMNDQVNALNLLGVKAAAINSGMTHNDIRDVYDLLKAGQIDLLYVSPEKILAGNFIYFLHNIKPALFAIDEAHCVSVWGNDFRPDYVALKIIKEQFKDIPVIALTATADATTQEDIKKQLQLRDAQTFLSSFERQNITITAETGKDRMSKIEVFLDNHINESGIIYCLSRKSTEKVSQKLESRGLKAAYYHAGMESTEREIIQRRFQNDEIQIICATIAFGMGIDKPNIRWVIHYNMPKNLEGFYQEIGRAGRDGMQAYSLLFYSWGDIIKLRSFVEDSQADESFKKIQLAKLKRMWEFASCTNCRTDFILNYFGEYLNRQCGHCDNCLNPPEAFDGSKYTKMAISAIVRSNQSINLNLLIDLLRGSGKSELKKMGLDQIKTFGVGREVPASHWLNYLTQMINQGILRVDFKDYSKIKLTSLARSVLDNKIQVTLSKIIAKPNPSSGSKSSGSHKVNISKDINDYDEIIFQKLRTWRAQMANKQKLPAYIILHDKSLKHIAATTPQNEQELLAIDGIGQQKLDKYGSEILDILQS